MNIIILYAVALLATLASWLYISNRKPSPAEAEESEVLTEETEQPEEKEIQEQEIPQKAQGGILKKPTGKQWIFLGLMLLGLWVIAVVLEFVYESNTLLDNLKLITLLSLLFTAANIDAKERVIPNKLVLAGLVLRVAFWVAELCTEPQTFLAVVKDNLVACALVIAFFIIGVLIIKDGLGMGDIKLMLVMCLFQGFYGVVSALFCALFVAFVYAIVVLSIRKKTRKDSVAFAPAILLGTMLSIFLTGM